MVVLIVILIFVLIAAIVAVVGAPLRSAAAARRGGGEHRGAPAGGARRDELEAAREAKYREIRDAEMDFRTGKLSDHDYRSLDAELRAEALTILDDLQALDRDGVEPD